MSDRFSTPPGAPPPEPGGKPCLPSPMAIATELWIVVVLGQAIAYAGQYPTASESVREAARDASSGATADEIRMLTSTGTVVGVYGAVGVVLALLSLLVVWFARTGRNWARLVLVFFSAFVVVQTVLGLFGDSASSWTTVPAVLSGVAALGAAYLLVQRDSETYCRAMTAHRRGGNTMAGATNPYGPQGGAPRPPYPPQSPYSHPPYPPQQWPDQQRPDQQWPSRQPPQSSPPHDPYAYRPPQYPPSQYPPSWSGQDRGGDGSPPQFYPPANPQGQPSGPAAHDPRRDQGHWEPARGENVREREPRRPENTSGDGRSDDTDRGE